VTKLDYKKIYVYDDYLPYDSVNAIVPIVVRLVKPNSVVDVGCGRGAWLKAFMNHGITDVLGIDGLWQKARLVIPTENFVAHDLTQSLELGRRFDLAVCLEFVEHLEKEHSNRIVKMLTGLSSVVLFSAAIPLQGEDHHVNEQWPSFWAGLFAQYSYVPVDAVRGGLWTNDKVEPFYVQNTLFFVDSKILERYPLLLAAYKLTNPKMLAIIHPRLYLEKCVATVQPYIIARKVCRKILMRFVS
jgi:SAM-dependent methyltransferase